MRTMEITIKVSEPTLARTNYLNKEDVRTQEECIDKLMQAAMAGDEKELIQAARDIINNDNRNRKIKKHEEIIEGITKLILSNTKVGDATQPNFIAYIIQADGNMTYYCNREGSSHSDAYYYAAPLGACTTALNRLVEQGIFKMTYLVSEDSDRVERVYVRIK